MQTETEISFVGIVVVGLLWAGVSNRHLLLPVTLFAIFLLLYFPSLEFFVVEEYLTQSWMYLAVMIFGGLGLFISYYLRFRKIRDHNLVDYAKLSAILVAASALPIAFLSQSEISIIISLSYVCMVYYYDRLVKPFPGNQRKQIITTSVLGVTCMLLMAYALVQRTQAIRQREISIELEKKAKENERKALEALVEAAKQAEIAKRVLEDCKTK